MSLRRITTLYLFFWPLIVGLVVYGLHGFRNGTLRYALISLIVTGALSSVVVVFVMARLIVPLRELTLAMRDRRTDILERIARRSSLLELHRMIASFSGYLATEEESRRRLTGALQEKAVVLEETRAGLRHTQRLSSVGRMVAGVAHEINNPASYVAGNLAVLREYHATLRRRLSVLDEIHRRALVGDCSPESVAEILEHLEARDDEYEYDFVREDIPNLVQAMEEGMERIANIIQSLRLFTHREVPHRELVDVRGALHNAIGILTSKIRDTVGLNVVCDHPVGVLAGPGQMEQVCINLLSNALDAQQDGGMITVEIAESEDEAILIVRDEGTGIPEDELERVFEPFYTTKPVRTNSGLGLAVVNEIVHRNGGSVEIDSSLGEGTAITIALPLEPFPVEEIE